MPESESGRVRLCGFLSGYWVSLSVMSRLGWAGLYSNFAQSVRQSEGAHAQAWRLRRCACFPSCCSRHMRKLRQSRRMQRSPKGLTCRRALLRRSAFWRSGDGRRGGGCAAPQQRLEQRLSRRQAGSGYRSVRMRCLRLRGDWLAAESPRWRSTRLTQPAIIFILEPPAAACG